MGVRGRDPLLLLMSAPAAKASNDSARAAALAISLFA
jgi:hypothetical protein